MEEQEKKTRKSSGTKSNISKKTTNTKTPQKITKKTSGTKKATTVTKSTKRTSTKKEEKIINDSKESVEPKVIETKNKLEQKKKTKKIDDTQKNNTSKKDEKKLENTEEVNKPDKKAKTSEGQQKRYIEISIGTILAIILIAVLIVLNIALVKWAYSVSVEKNATSKNVLNTIEEKKEKVGTILNQQNVEVNKIIDKITLPPSVTASIYKAQGFSEETIPNDLKLRIGLAKIKEEDKFRARQVNGDSIIVIDRVAMEGSIKEIFGNQARYDDVSFDNTNIKEFANNSEIKEIVTYDSEKYTGTVNEAIERDTKVFIYQEIQKIIQYDDEIVVHVKPAFVKQENNSYVIYQNYDETFKNQLMKITHEELFGNSLLNTNTGEGLIAINTNNYLNSIRNELKTYKYVFEKDSSTQEYSLKEFRKENNI